VLFNALLAIIAVVGSIAYWFSLHGTHHIAKYFPLTGMGIVPTINHWYDYITKLLDIILWLLIGIIEFLWEFGRMLSLSLRLFGNMFVWMILLTLLLYATQSLLHYPIVGPIVIFAYEFAVSLLQAFIFSLLTTIYFKLSAEH
jgi:F0F1-type ATP synthase membrane subunit a